MFLLLFHGSIHAEGVIIITVFMLIKCEIQLSQENLRSDSIFHNLASDDLNLPEIV